MITDDQIRSLRLTADAAGDLRLVYLCCDALRSFADGRPQASPAQSEQARAVVAEFITRSVQP
jgi:hypothetical protein